MRQFQQNMSLQMEESGYKKDKNLFYVIKLDQKRQMKHRVQIIEKYYNTKKNNLIIDGYFQQQVNAQKEGLMTIKYYGYDHLMILPLNIFIEKLQKECEKLNNELQNLEKEQEQLNKQEKLKNKNEQEKLKDQIQACHNTVEIIIWSIVNEYRLMRYDYQLFHNCICLKNILITSIDGQKQLYFNNIFSKIDVRFINFDLREEFELQTFEKYSKKDFGDLLEIVIFLSQIIQKQIKEDELKKKILEFYQLIKYVEKFRNRDAIKQIKGREIFLISWSDYQKTTFDSISKLKNDQIPLTLSVLKGILLQNWYMNPNKDENAFKQLIQKYIGIQNRIIECQQNYEKELINFQNLLVESTKQSYKLDINFGEFNRQVQDFDKNVFEKIVDLANFNPNAIDAILEIVYKQYQSTTQKSKQLLEDYCQQELDIFILSLYCDLN